MTLELTTEQLQALQRGEAVRLTAGSLGELVVLQATTFDEALSEEREKAALAQVARKAADRWGRENPYVP